MLTDKQRAAAVAHAEFLIANGPKHLGYEFGGGDAWLDESMAGLEKRFAAGEIWYPDCSRSVNWICRWAAWKSPTGLGWTGSSGEMWAHLPHFSDVRSCEPGSLVVYGPGGVNHAAMVIADAGTTNPTLFSHGSAFTNNQISYSTLTGYFAEQGLPVTLLTVGDL